MNKDFAKYLDKVADTGSPSSAEEVSETMKHIAAREKIPDKKQWYPRWVKPLGLIAACAVVVVGAITLLSPDDNNYESISGSSDYTVYAAASYSDVYDALNKYQLKSRDFSYLTDSNSASAVESEMAADGNSAPPAQAYKDSEAAFDSAAESSDDGYGANDYSETNNQVKGVDEGDIVKTDGEYIYILSNKQLIISSAQGADSAIISQTSILPDYDTMQAGSYNEYSNELYVSGDRLAIITSKYTWGADTYYDDMARNSDYLPANKDLTNILIYDISDPASPREIGSISQDGYYTSSRMINGMIYLISEYYCYQDPQEDAPATYVPCVYRNGQAELVDANDICISSQIIDTSYVVVSSIDMEQAELLDTLTVLGSGDIVYMNAENLYIAGSRYETAESEPRTVNQYTVVDYTESNYTYLIRLALNDGQISMEADTRISGYLESQFSMDEYEGYLRLVTTNETNSYTIYRDEQYGWENYDWDDASYHSGNDLYVLDGDLEIVGSITGLAPDEYIYSARFSGDIGYFVTFRQVDPLFAVDLSDPEEPKVLSALKIPGFSQYLHIYTEGRLFGLGMDADEDTGRTNGMKLSMFDISDPADVSEKHTLKLESSYSEALYNHKAVLISAEHDLIAFPVDDGYDVYGYSDDQGFYKRGHFDTGDWYYNTRGLYVNDAIYICGYDNITIVDMDSLEHLATLNFEVDEETYDYFMIE